MDGQLKRNLTAGSTWTRGLFMLLFLIVYSVGETVWFLIVVFQFLHTLVMRKPLESLLDFGEDLCTYLYEILLFVSFSSDERPYPFSPWPGRRVDDVAGVEAADDETSRSAGETPTGSSPAEDQPAAKGPAEVEPAEEKPADEAPARKAPAKKKPAAKKTATKKPPAKKKDDSDG